MAKKQATTHKARFKVDSRTPNGNGFAVVLQPQPLEKHKDNSEFFDTAPSGRIELNNVSKEIGEALGPGQLVDLTLTAVD
jgi:hypothetical protein